MPCVHAQGAGPVSDWLPARAQEAAAALAGLAAPALLLQAGQRAAAALHPRPPKRVKRSISQSGRACSVFWGLSSASLGC